MDIMAWILLVVCGPLAVQRFYWAITGNITRPMTYVAFFLTTVISALSAGIIWGGLFRGF